MFLTCLGHNLPHIARSPHISHLKHHPTPDIQTNTLKRGVPFLITELPEKHSSDPLSLRHGVTPKSAYHQAPVIPEPLYADQCVMMLYHLRTIVDVGRTAIYHSHRVERWDEVTCLRPSQFHHHHGTCDVYDHLHPSPIY